MSEPFLGEMRMFGGNFAPRGWALCNGQLLPIWQNTALFSLLGTTYGGDGETTFALPDLRSRSPMHKGNGAGLSSRHLGEKGGTETETLSVLQIPPHSHAPTANANYGTEKEPAPGRSHAWPGDNERNYSSAASDSNMKQMNNTGNGQGHNNMQPYLCIYWIIALQGIFPSRS